MPPIFKQRFHGRPTLPAADFSIHWFVTFWRGIVHTLSAMRSEPLILTWKTGQQEGTSILEVNGPLVMNNLFSFQEEVAREKPQVLIVDLSGSAYMDSAGLGSLLNTYVSTEKRGGKLLLSGVNERIQALLEMTKVHVLLKTFATPAAAEESLSSH